MLSVESLDHQTAVTSFVLLSGAQTCKRVTRKPSFAGHPLCSCEVLVKIVDVAKEMLDWSKTSQTHKQ